MTKFIYSEKATKFCDISTLLLSYVVPVKNKAKISQTFVAFSENINFIKNTYFNLLDTIVHSKIRLEEILPYQCHSILTSEQSFLQQKMKKINNKLGFALTKLSLWNNKWNWVKQKRFKRQPGVNPITFTFSENSNCGQESLLEV